MQVEKQIKFIEEISKDEEQIKIFLNLLGNFILMNEEVEEYSIEFKGNVPNSDIKTKGKFEFKSN